MESATVVWVAQGATERTAEADRALSEWGRSHGLVLAAPSADRTPHLSLDLSLADAVEQELEKARDAFSALDVDTAEHALTDAETTLREHPELPQGAWLMAEVERGWARRWMTLPPKSPERAAEAWQRAQVLDAGREPGLGEVASPMSEEEVSFQLAVDAKVHARLDGRPVALGALRSMPGEHQLTLTHNGALVWAGWVGVAEGGVVRVVPPQAPPCSSEDLEGVVSEGTHVRADGVMCNLWVAVKPLRPGALLVAVCRMDRCGALLEWRADGGVPAVPGPSPHARWPAWATWTLVGVGAAAVAAVTIGIDVAFRASSPSFAFTQQGCMGCRTAAPSSFTGAGQSVKKR